MSFVVAGKDAAAEGRFSEDEEYAFTWPHAYTLTDYHDLFDTPEAPVLDGVAVDDYIAIAEFVKNASNDYVQEGLGTLAHELGHYIGLPDLYDTSGYPYAGKWKRYDVWDMSLMNNGCYGTDLEGNDVPFSLDMWSRVKLGWVEPVDITSEDGVMSIAGSLTTGETPIAYRIDGEGEGEYFLYNPNELVRGYILGGTAAISEANAIHFREQ